MNRTAMLYPRPVGGALAVLAFALLTGRPAAALGPTLARIEPDDYPAGTVLDNVSPFVKLSTGAFSDNRPTFSVTAETEPADASTGTKVFAHVGIPFWNTSRTFRMDFLAPVAQISIDYIASGFASNAFAGRLEAYSAGGALVAFDETALLGEAQFETMTVAAPGIAYALAYPPADPFGDLDNLRFTVVPEPHALGLAAAGATLIVQPRRRRARSVSDGSARGAAAFGRRPGRT